jgi:hypothetical protein
MSLTVSDIIRNADLFRAAYPSWPHAEPERRPLPPVLAALRDECTEAGITAVSPPGLGPEGERLAREERWT